MRQFFIVILFSFFCLVNGNSQKLTHVLGEIIVQVQNDRDMQSLIGSLEDESFRESSFPYSQLCREPLNLWVIKSDPNDVHEADLLSILRNSDQVIVAQYNHLINYRTIPNDPGFTSQWQYINDGSNNGKVDADLDIDQAWDITTGGMTASGDEIVTCIIDDGIFKDHEDLGGRLWTNNSEIPNNGIDDDNNGWVDDYLGWDIDTGIDSSIYDNGKHGTPVAGIIGAAGNNGIGVSGINWNSKMMIIRGQGDEAKALAAYSYPYYFRKLYNETNGEQGAFVVSTNASWGTDYGQADDAPIWCEFYDKLGQVGILNCGATINKNENVDEVGDLPTTCPSDFLIGVTNVNRKDIKVTSAGFGKEHIDLGAFGAAAYTAKRYNSYNGFNGTSSATPHVTGTISLLYSIPCLKFAELYKSHPALAARFVKHVILSGVDPIASLLNKTVSGGRLNVNNSMNLAMDMCNSIFYPTDAVIDQSGAITWSLPSGATQTNMRYRSIGASVWITKNDINSVYQFENLDICAEYEVQLQSVFSGNITSDYSYSYKFETEGCCYTPADIAYSFVPGTIHVKMEWSSTGQVDNFEFQYKKVNNNDWISFEVESNSIILDNLENCENYQCRIKSNCSLMNSIYTEIIQFSSECGSCTQSDYCDVASATSHPDNDEEWIERVELEGLDNMTEAESNGYGNYLGITIPILKQGNTYDITLTPAFSDGIYKERFHVWIDFNQDQAFSESELVFDTLFDISKENVQGKIIIPINTVVGITRMRVAMRYNNTPYACNGYDYGEVEDYCVDIVDKLNSTIDTGIENVISISPNPFIDRLNIDISSINDEDIVVELRNIQGQLITRVNKKIISSKTNSIYFESLENLAAGLYFITIDNTERRLSYKVIKL